MDKSNGVDNAAVITGTITLVYLFIFYFTGCAGGTDLL